MFFHNLLATGKFYKNVNLNKNLFNLLFYIYSCLLLSMFGSETGSGQLIGYGSGHKGSDPTGSGFVTLVKFQTYV